MNNILLQMYQYRLCLSAEALAPKIYCLVQMFTSSAMSRQIRRFTILHGDKM